MALTKPEILQLFDELEAELAKGGVRGEVYLVGGAVMTVALNARPSTNDVDAYFVPSAAVRQAAARIAARRELDPRWLNDGAKAFMGPAGRFTAYLDRPHLKVLTATPEYLLAMKCLSMRLGPEFHDEADVRFLLRYLNLEDLPSVEVVLARYYPLKQYPPKTLDMLEEVLSQGRGEPRR